MQWNAMECDTRQCITTMKGRMIGFCVQAKEAKKEGEKEEKEEGGGRRKKNEEEERERRRKKKEDEEGRVKGAGEGKKREERPFADQQQPKRRRCNFRSLRFLSAPALQ